MLNGSFFLSFFRPFKTASYVLLLCMTNYFSLSAQQNAGKLTISHLTGDFYIYTTYKLYGEELFPANGMYIVSSQGVALIDTPFDTTQCQPLLDSIEKRHHQKVIYCISTHSHDDRTGGVNFLKRKGIITYSSLRTFLLFKEPGEFTSQFYFSSDTTFTLVSHSFKTHFAGEGHSYDNIVLWFEQEKILYGGCLVKSVEAKDLGNISHANMAQYPLTIKKLMTTYKNAEFVIPGHYDWKNNQSLLHTLNLLNAHDDLLQTVKDFVVVSKFDEAIEILEENIDEVVNDTTGLFEAIANLYFYKKQWKKIIDIYSKHKLEVDEDTTLFAMARYYSPLNTEKIEFKNSISTNKFDYSISGTPIIEAIINGKKMNCWFDTGAGLTTISSRMAKKCKLKMTSNSKTGATAATGKIVGTELGIMDSICVNGLLIKNHACLVLNKRDLEFRVLGIRILKIDAIIGWNFIQEFDVKINSSTKTIVIGKPSVESPSSKMQNFIWMGQPMINCTDTAGKKFLFFIDTGAQAPGVYNSYLTKADTSKAILKTIHMGSAGGMVSMKGYRFPSVKMIVDNKLISMKNVPTEPDSGSGLFECDGVLGINQFKNHNIHFNSLKGFFNFE